MISNKYIKKIINIFDIINIKTFAKIFNYINQSIKIKKSILKKNSLKY